MGRMKTLLTILLALCMLGVLGVLLAGVAGLARGNGSAERSNRLMRWRVILQGVALLLFLLLLLTARS